MGGWVGGASTFIKPLSVKWYGMIMQRAGIVLLISLLNHQLGCLLSLVVMWTRVPRRDDGEIPTVLTGGCLRTGLHCAVVTVDRDSCHL